MKQYKLIRNLCAEKASQREAEQILGRKIHNFLYGSEGYLIEEGDEHDWMPKTEFEKQAVRVNSPLDNYQYMIKEIDNACQYLKEQRKKSKFQYKQNRITLTIKRMETLKSDIDKIINLELSDL